MNQLETLRSQLRNANVSDDMMARGVRLTDKGTATLCQKLGCNEEELRALLSELAQEVKAELANQGGVINLNEFAETRFTYELDFMGNLELRDGKTGQTLFLQGDDAFKLTREIERIYPDYQELLAPYFEQTLREFLEEDDVHGDMGNSGGTYNFPYKGQFACARFYLSGKKPVVEVISLVDGKGEEVVMDAQTKADVNRVAWEWVDKV